MTGKLFIEQLKQGWADILKWGSGLALLTMFMGAMVEDPATLEGYRSLLESFPPAMLSAFGLSDAALLTTAEGFIAFAGFTYGSIIMAVYGVMSGLNIITNDEDSGMMNIILAQPTPRWQVIVERFAAYILITLGIGVMVFVGVFAGTLIFNLELDLMKMFLGAMNLVPMTLAIMGITTLVGAVFSNKMIVTGVAAGIILVSYVINTIADAIDTAEVPLMGLVDKVSVFNYLQSEGIILNGHLNLVNITILLVITAVAIVMSVFAFENRDIAG